MLGCKILLSQKFCYGPLKRFSYVQILKTEDDKIETKDKDSKPLELREKFNLRKTVIIIVIYQGTSLANVRHEKKRVPVMIAESLVM